MTDLHSGPGGDIVCSTYMSVLDQIYTVSGKKRVWSISGITSSNTDRFFKFFHYYNLQKICNKAIVKYPTTPSMRQYTTL